MQISQTTSHQPEKVTSRNANNNYKASFKGSTIVGIMDAIDRGGLFASFTIQDMLGTNVPRPVMGLMRNKKENNGKKNTTFALKETIREFTTGPSMFIIPGAMLAVTGRFIGNAVKVPTEFIKGLGDIFKETATEVNIKDAKQIKLDYYKQVIKNALETTTSNIDNDFTKEAEEFADNIANLASKKKKNVIQNMKGTPIEGSYNDAFAEIVDNFTKIIRKNVSDPMADYTQATIKDLSGKSYTTGIGTLIDHMTNYADDAIKSTKKALLKPEIKNVKEFLSSTIDKFNIKRINTRFGLNAAMTVALLSFLAIIPKLYNISKENPGLVGLDKDTAIGALPADSAKIQEGANK